MKLLKDVIYGASILQVKGSTNIAVEHVVYDSRKAGKFTMFVALKGALKLIGIKTPKNKAKPTAMSE